MDNRNRPYDPYEYPSYPIYDPEPYADYRPVPPQQPEPEPNFPRQPEPEPNYPQLPLRSGPQPYHRPQAPGGPRPEVSPERELPRFFLFLQGWVEAFTSSLVIVILLFTFLFRSVAVDGSSMVPTLEDQDRLLVTSMFYTPKREDIVVIIPTQSMPRALIKRVVALEGETVDITMVNGEVQVLINGKKLNEPYLGTPMNAVEGETRHYEVPKGHVFVMGDNRNNSIDSRREEVGMVDTRSIMGKALFRVLPIDRFGLLDYRGGLEE